MAASSFGGLPPELRNRIYELTLIAKEPIVVVIRNINGARGGRLRDKRSGLATGLLRTCKLIHAEAQPVFLGCNTFEVLARQETATPVLDTFLHNTTTLPNLHLLRRVHVQLGEDYFDSDVERGMKALAGTLKAVKTQTAWLPQCQFSIGLTPGFADGSAISLELRPQSRQSMEQSISECAVHVTKAVAATRARLVVITDDECLLEHELTLANLWRLLLDLKSLPTLLGDKGAWA